MQLKSAQLAGLLARAAREAKLAPVWVVTGDEPLLVIEAGDAILFDDMNLHRTAVTPEMTEERYAIESWFFAPSHFPDTQIPVVV